MKNGHVSSNLSPPNMQLMQRDRLLCSCSSACLCSNCTLAGLTSSSTRSPTYSPLPVRRPSEYVSSHSSRSLPLPGSDREREGGGERGRGRGRERVAFKKCSVLSGGPWPTSCGAARPAGNAHGRNKVWPQSYVATRNHCSTRDVRCSAHFIGKVREEETGEQISHSVAPSNYPL